MDLTNFDRFGTSPLYVAKDGLQAAIVSSVGIGFLELNVLRKDNPLREYGNQLDISGFGRIVQNPETKLFFHDHHGDGFYMTYAFNLEGGNRDSYESIPITEKHLQQYYIFSYQVPALNKDDKRKSIKDTFNSLKSLALNLHNLVMIVSQDYIAQDTTMASVPILGKQAKQRRDSARISTGVFDYDTNYYIACYHGDSTGKTIKQETYEQRRIERQLSLFNPPVSM